MRAQIGALRKRREGKLMEREKTKGMVKKVTGIWYLWVFLLCMVFAGGVNAEAAALGSEQYLKGTDLTMYYDLTGDGKNDTIVVHTTMENTYYYKNFQVSVNGKVVLTRKISGCTGVSARYMSCSKKKNYLQIQAYMDGGYMYLNKIYSWTGSKLAEAADLGRADNMAATVTRVSKSGITVKFSVQPVETGRIEWKFMYKPSGKRLKLKSNSAKATSVLGEWPMDDGYGKYFKQNKFVTASGRTFYTSTNLKKKAFATKTGDILTLQKVKIIGKKMYLGFKKNGRIGWRRIKSVYSSTGYWFYGVNNRLAG